MIPMVDILRVGCTTVIYTVSVGIYFLFEGFAVELRSNDS